MAGEGGGRVFDRDLGYARIVRNLGMIRAASLGGSGPSVFVGVRDAAGPHTDGTPLILIAAVQEFGSADGHVPERSFLRSTIDEQREKYVGLIVKILEASYKAPIGSGRAVLRGGLGRLGALAVGDVQKKITALNAPPNAPSTIAKKGSANPLIDTGRLRQSIDFEVQGI